MNREIPPIACKCPCTGWPLKGKPACKRQHVQFEEFGKLIAAILTSDLEDWITCGQCLTAA